MSQMNCYSCNLEIRYTPPRLHAILYDCAHYLYLLMCPIVSKNATMPRLQTNEKKLGQTLAIHIMRDKHNNNNMFSLKSHRQTLYNTTFISLSTLHTPLWSIYIDYEDCFYKGRESLKGWDLNSKHNFIYNIVL